MEIIKTRICRINNEKRISLLFNYNEEIIAMIKKIKGRKWFAKLENYRTIYTCFEKSN
ncbi:MAG: hypothetical protein KAW87_06545 [Candidatus Cloacimonetes bacterium]|nr:hypothetical protein [Candidatus Cloacimonadota bacterium]